MNERIKKKKKKQNQNWFAFGFLCVCFCLCIKLPSGSHLISSLFSVLFILIYVYDIYIYIYIYMIIFSVSRSLYVYNNIVGFFFRSFVRFFEIKIYYYRVYRLSIIRLDFVLSTTLPSRLSLSLWENTHALFETI